MDGLLFVQAVGIGAAVAVPVGPIGLLVVERSLRQGFGVGLVTGLGAAVADAVYGAVGAFGVTALLSALLAARVPLVLGGSLVLLVLAWRTWRGARSAAATATVPAGGAPVGGLAAAFGSAVLLTLANPATVLSFVAIFGALAGGQAAGPVGPVGPATALAMVAGVFTGSALWWLLLAGGVARLRHRLTAATRQWLAVLSAALLAGFALVQLARLARVASAPAGA